MDAGGYDAYAESQRLSTYMQQHDQWDISDFATMQQICTQQQQQQQRLCFDDVDMLQPLDMEDAVPVQEEETGSLWDQVFYEGMDKNCAEINHVVQQQQQFHCSSSEYSYDGPSSSPSGSNYSTSSQQDSPTNGNLATDTSTSKFNIPDISVLESADCVEIEMPKKATTSKQAEKRHPSPGQRERSSAAGTSIRYGIPSGTIKCPVCVDGESGSHTYYGGKVCHSCRGFFRRSVQNNHYPFFTCKHGRTCQVESKTRQVPSILFAYSIVVAFSNRYKLFFDVNLFVHRKSCKWCRFNRCLEQAGLQVDLVLSSQQRRQLELKKTQNRIAKRNKRVTSSGEGTVAIW